MDGGRVLGLCWMVSRAQREDQREAFDAGNGDRNTTTLYQSGIESDCAVSGDDQLQQKSL